MTSDGFLVMASTFLMILFSMQVLTTTPVPTGDGVHLLDDPLLSRTGRLQHRAGAAQRHVRLRLLHRHRTAAHRASAHNGARGGWTSGFRRFIRQRALLRRPGQPLQSRPSVSRHAGRRWPRAQRVGGLVLPQAR